MNQRNNLTNALLANAAFSGITGLGALTLAGRLADSLGPPAWSLRAIGACLLVFAALVAREARNPQRAGTHQIIVADLAWVVAATALMGVTPGWMTGTGRIALAAVTVVVAVIALAQWRGLQTSGTS